jgi:microcystin-dependent protein
MADFDINGTSPQHMKAQKRRKQLFWSIKKMRYIKTKLTVAGIGAVLLSSISTSAQAGCNPDTYIGTVCFMATNFCPRGFLPANGAILDVRSHPALFALFGTRYGGNGSTTMGLPDLRGRAPVGTGQGVGLQFPVTLGELRGTQTTTLEVSQMAPHSHGYDLSNINVTGKIKASSATGTLGSPAGHYLAGSSVSASPQYKSTGTTTAMAANTVSGNLSTSGITSTSVTGGGNAFANQGPRLGLTACIADDGNVFPPRG